MFLTTLKLAGHTHLIHMSVGVPMTCEICDTATATMWVEKVWWVEGPGQYGFLRLPIPSCDDCGPQLGYVILSPLEPSSTSS